MKDIQVSAGRSATFQVQVTGHPPPVITWLKDNFLITPNHEYQVCLFVLRSFVFVTVNGRFQMSELKSLIIRYEKQVKEDGDGVSKLTIGRVAPVHEATYTARALNSGGEAKLLAQLSVRPATPPPPQLEPPAPPTFTELFGNVTVRVGSRMVLQCRITGNPRPKVIDDLLITIVYGSLE